jgi:hypothetical protein
MLPNSVHPFRLLGEVLGQEKGESLQTFILHVLVESPGQSAGGRIGG